MDDAQLLVLELGSKGYSCAQMVMIGGLRLMGRENHDLVRAMAGLAQGVGASGEICGALSGGVCLIGLHTGKGEDAEEPLPEAPLIMNQLVEWFQEDLCAGGAITCDAILGCGPESAADCRGMDAMRCGDLVARTWSKAVSLLLESGIDPAQGRELP
ncbi:C-GCAxxG-C-C family protein [Desulfovibrio sp. OttesenSCG-928-A18]|nr:C-GCAxxG-C-C family protein [Desulfovibrio sp. OttesenSCG-928-A18]